ncbi:hypothetical protein C8R43DRAFT_1126456 [Mycena crocata]|nr:hypothetical protein C8R43DRAFT_1126456 [Mycena crocata]
MEELLTPTIAVRDYIIQGEGPFSHLWSHGRADGEDFDRPWVLSGRRPFLEILGPPNLNDIPEEDYDWEAIEPTLPSPFACAAAALLRIKATRMFWSAMVARRTYDLESDIPPPLAPEDLPPVWLWLTPRFIRHLAQIWPMFDYLPINQKLFVSPKSRDDESDGFVFLHHTTMAEIYRSKTFWADFHRNRKERSARKAQEATESPFPALHDQAPVYTFIPNRAKPITSIVQNNGRLLSDYTPADSAASIPSRVSAPASMVRPHQHRSHVAVRAQKLLAARASPDAILLARLQESDEERAARKRREFIEGIRMRLGSKRGPIAVASKRLESANGKEHKISSKISRQSK